MYMMRPSWDFFFCGDNGWMMQDYVPSTTAPYFLPPPFAQALACASSKGSHDQSCFAPLAAMMGGSTQGPPASTMMAPASTMMAPASMAGDPHIVAPHGGRFDFRGEDHALYNFHSSRNLTLNVMTELADFELHDTSHSHHKTVHGSFITRAFLRISELSTGVSKRAPFHRIKTACIVVR